LNITILAYSHASREERRLAVSISGLCHSQERMVSFGFWKTNTIAIALTLEGKTLAHVRWTPQLTTLTRTGHRALHHGFSLTYQVAQGEPTMVIY